MNVPFLFSRVCRVTVLAALLGGGGLRAGADDAAAPPSPLQAADAPAGALWVETLDLKNMPPPNTWSKARAGQSQGGKPLTLGGVVYPHGIGAQAPTVLNIDLKGAATRFQSVVGVDDEGIHGEVVFSVWVDGKKMADSGVIRHGDAPQTFSVDLTGAHHLRLEVSDNGDPWDDHADWAGALLTLAPGATAKPESYLPTVAQKPVILPPDPRPALHGPRVVGASPGRPLLFRIPATGTPPLTFSAAPLPSGVTLDPKTGVLSGRMATAGTYTVRVGVTNALGTTQRTLALVCQPGARALTPPLGWNSWNVYANAVTDANMRDAADWLVKTGLAAHGWQTVTLDDSWQGPRDPKTGEISPNRRVGDVKALADYVHAQGLKLGLYSAPTAQTCSGFLGSLGHEETDAQTYARWGVDFLKYDWCPNPLPNAGSETDPTDAKAAYTLMGAALEKTDRDIVYGVSTYGKENPWDWATKAGGNTWSSSPTFLDTWEYLAKVVFAPVWKSVNAKPGHWDDPGPLMVGKIGYGDPHRSHLTPNEQMVQMSMWSLLSAPLTISCDLTQLDPNAFFPATTAILTNDEVLDIDQDPLGTAARQQKNIGGVLVWTKPLADGTTALGLFNPDVAAWDVTVPWVDLNLADGLPVRDVWKHQDLGVTADSQVYTVPNHGVLLLKIGTPKPDTP